MKGNHLVEESEVFWDGRGRKEGRTVSSTMRPHLLLKFGGKAHLA